MSPCRRASTRTTPDTAIDACSPTRASVSASLVTSEVAVAPAPPSSEIDTTSAVADATFSPSALTFSAAASVATSTRSPSNSAFTAPPTRAVGSITEMLTRPPPPPSAVAVAVFWPVASTSTVAPGAVIAAVCPTSASTSAEFVTSAEAFAPAPENSPTAMARAFASALLSPIAWTLIASASETSPSNDASTPPPTSALNPATPTATAPPAPLSERAIASLSARAVTHRWPSVATLALSAAEASTSASAVTSASVPVPVRLPPSPSEIASVRASALLTPSASTVTLDEPSTSPFMAATVPPLTCASDSITTPVINPPAPPFAEAVAMFVASAATFSAPDSVICASVPMRASVSALAAMVAIALMPAPPATLTEAAIGSAVAVLREMDDTRRLPASTVALAPISALVRPLTVESTTSAAMATTPAVMAVVVPSAVDVESALTCTAPAPADTLPFAPM